VEKQEMLKKVFRTSFFIPQLLLKIKTLQQTLIRLKLIPETGR